MPPGQEPGRLEYHPVTITLEVLGGPMDGQTFTITRSSDIGRDEASPIALPQDPFVSRRHARILVAEPECFLEDFNSTNGTFVGPDQLKGRILLANGQEFKVGKTRMIAQWPA